MALALELAPMAAFVLLLALPVAVVHHQNMGFNLAQELYYDVINIARNAGTFNLYHFIALGAPYCQRAPYIILS